MALVLDSSALIALERNDRPMWTRLKAEHAQQRLPKTHAGVVGQVWRGRQNQARLALALSGMDVLALDQRLCRAAGQLLGRCGLSDVIDACVALMADDGDEIVTDDLDDLSLLAAGTGKHVELVKP